MNLTVWYKTLRKNKFAILHCRDYKENGYKLSAQWFLGSCGWKGVTSDLSMVHSNTIDQSLLRVCPPKSFQKLLRLKLAPILPSVPEPENFEAARKTGSELSRIALWDCFWGPILTQFPVQPRSDQRKKRQHPQKHSHGAILHNTGLVLSAILKWPPLNIPPTNSGMEITRLPGASKFWSWASKNRSLVAQRTSEISLSGLKVSAWKLIIQNWKRQGEWHNWPL